MCATEQNNNSFSEFSSPYIKDISRNGLVRIIWNVDMIVPKNLTALTVRDSANNDFAPINISILPGSNKKDPLNLIITSYKVTNFTEREIQI